MAAVCGRGPRCGLEMRERACPGRIRSRRSWSGVVTLVVELPRKGQADMKSVPRHATLMENDMNHSKTIRSILCLTLLALALVGPALAADRYTGYEGSEPVRAIYDFRHGTAKTAEIFLGLIHDTLRDEAFSNGQGSTEFAVVFMGPSLRLISTPAADASAEDKAAHERIASRLSAMAADGIDLEVCLFAANVMGIPAQNFHQDIRRIENGWVSEIGYQRAGYALVPVY